MWIAQVYRRHFRELLRYKFPRCYDEALKLTLQGTDHGGIDAACWHDILSCIQNVDSTENSGDIQTSLTLQQVSLF